MEQMCDYFFVLNGDSLVGAYSNASEKLRVNNRIVVGWVTVSVVKVVMAVCRLSVHGCRGFDTKMHGSLMPVLQHNRY